MELVPYVRILRRRWYVVAALLVLGLFLATASWFLQNEERSFYRATHTLVASGGSVNLEQAAAVAVAGDVPERVAARLPGSTAAELAAQVRATARPDVGFVEITAVGTDPARAVAVADAFAEELSSYMARLDQAGDEARTVALQTRLDEVGAELAQLQQQLAVTVDPTVRTDLSTRIASRQGEQATLTTELESLRQAALTTSVLQTFATAQAVPISGPQFRELFKAGTSDGADPAAAIAGSQPLGLVPRLVLGGTFGLLAGVAAALVLERVDPRLRTKSSAEEVFGWPVITEVPPLSRSQQHEKAVLSTSAPRSRTAEAYRVLRSSVLLAGSGAVPVDDDLHRPTRAEGEGLVVLVTSASPTEGKTTTVANLAAVLGESGAKVLVINCDFRRPTLGAYLGVDTHLAKVVPTDVPNVRLLAQVTDDPEHVNPAEVIATQRQIIAEARRRFDVVVLDTAPLLTTNDANDVLSTADLVIVVARAGKTTREAADRCAEALERRRAPVLGVVLVAAADAPAGRYYYYGDYYVNDEPSTKRRAAPAEQTETVLVSAPTAVPADGDGLVEVLSGTPDVAVPDGGDEEAVDGAPEDDRSVGDRLESADEAPADEHGTGGLDAVTTTGGDAEPDGSTDATDTTDTTDVAAAPGGNQPA